MNCSFLRIKLQFTPHKTRVHSGENCSSFGMKLEFGAEQTDIYLATIKQILPKACSNALERNYINT